MADRMTSSGGRPLIGVTPRWVEPVEYLGEMLAPSEAIADNFADAIIAAGGMMDLDVDTSKSDYTTEA